MTLVLPATSTATSSTETWPWPRSHRALLASHFVSGDRLSRLEQTHSVPLPGPGQVLVHTSHVALNPYDWQGIQGAGPSREARVLGRDGAGRVVAVGSGVKRLMVGDRVWFCANSSLSTSGAFQDYSVHASAEVGLVPDNLSDEEAAALGSGLLTAGVTLFRTLGISLDLISASPASDHSPDSQPWILIWGGAGITGVYMIQLARLLGYRIVCAASPANHAYVRSLGADVVLDRWSPPLELVESIRRATNDKVRIAIDNVGSETAALCELVLRGSFDWRLRNGVSGTEPDRNPAQLVPIAGFPSPPILGTDGDTVRSVNSLRISFSSVFYGHPDFSAPLLDTFFRLLASKELLPARVRLIQGGFDGILQGLYDLRDGRVPGGYKLVARIEDNCV